MEHQYHLPSVILAAFFAAISFICWCFINFTCGFESCGALTFPATVETTALIYDGFYLFMNDAADEETQMTLAKAPNSLEIITLPESRPWDMEKTKSV